MRLIAAALAALSLALAGCGGGTKGSAPSSNARNEADWAQAKEEARKQIEPLEASLGVAVSRQHERELAKEGYEVLVAKEHETPQEKREGESYKQTPAKEQAEKQVQAERESEGG